MVPRATRGRLVAGDESASSLELRLVRDVAFYSRVLLSVTRARFVPLFDDDRTRTSWKPRAGAVTRLRRPTTMCLARTTLDGQQGGSTKKEVGRIRKRERNNALSRLTSARVVLSSVQRVSQRPIESGC